VSAEDLDRELKLKLYRITAEQGRIPNASELSEVMGLPRNDVVAAFARLHAKRLLVPEPGDPARVRMAPPFSGVPTAFPVEANGKRYYANCVWDAFGIAAALHSDAVIPASDAYTGDPLTLEITNNQPLSQPYVAHFAVPAAHWWDDIVFT
jgi:DNA-binding transcriptional MocR family regulator